MKTISTILIAAATVLPAAAQATDGIIENPPANCKKTTYSRNSIGLQLNMLSMLQNQEYYGWACDIYEDGETVYMSNPLCVFPMDTYIKGTKTETGFSFPLPQPIYHVNENGTEETFYVDMFYYNPTTGEYDKANNNEERSYDLELLPNGSYKFDYWAVHSDANAMGTYYYTDRLLGLSEGSTGDWMAYSELTCRLIPFDNTMVTPPRGLETTQYQFIYSTNGYYVNVGRDGNDIYVQGFNEYDPPTWVKGTVEGNKAIFPSMQYIGVGDGYTLFLSGAEMNGTEIVPLDNLTFEYDEAEDTYRAENLVWLASSPEKDETFQTYDEAVIKPIAEITDFNPKAPEITKFYNYDQSLEFGLVRFILSGLSESGSVLPWDGISYALFIDGDLYFMDPADYERHDEEMSWIPADFTDNWDIFVFEQGNRSVYFYALVDESLAVQSRYKDDEGIYHYSEKAYEYVNGFGGVENVGNNVSIESEDCYDLTGRRVSGNTNGLTIRVLKMSDGSVRTVKAVK